MSVLQNGPKGARLASFGFAITVFTLLPSEIGYQDIAALLARQPGVAERWQKHVIASPFGAIHAATFSFPRPIGSSIPAAPRIRLASLSADVADITGSVSRNPLGQVIRPPRREDFPAVDRSAKGDRLSTKGDRLSAKGDRLPARAAPFEPEAAEQQPPGEEASAPADSNTIDTATKPAPADTAAPLDAELEAALQSAPLPQYEANSSEKSLPPPKDNFTVHTAHLYFGQSSLGTSTGALERWQPGEEPRLVLPGQVDTDLKQSAALPGAALEGSTVAPKGELTIAPQRLKSPAERLGLDEKAYTKAMTCLANAIYFEARSEPIRGQIAVAQVVVNRAFSGYYPTTVCGVVYQNAHRYLSCQFTFACDGIRDVVTEPEHWERAKKIAKAMLDGRLWLPEVDRSTHYHATYVRPYWIREMKKMYKTGLHVFYRPRQWGDGSDAPSWGTAEETAAVAAKV